MIALLPRLAARTERLESSKIPQNGLWHPWIASIVSVLVLGSSVLSQESTPAPLTPATQMLPADTQAFFMLPDSERFLANWSKTQLGKLAADKMLKQFWETQKDEIQSRFQDAGWQLSLEMDDISDISGGQTALAWIARPKTTAKPYSIAMIIDVAGRIAPTENLLKRIDGQLKTKGATSKTTEVNGTKVTNYILPKTPADPRVRESFYALSKEQLIATDDLATMTELLAAQDGKKSDALANSELYKAVQTKISNRDDAPEIEYFVRPIGFARLLRSISSKPSNNQADVLKILEKEGFENIQCLAGNVQILKSPYDFAHQGYVLVKKPTSESVKILDFPNLKEMAVPDFVNRESSSVLSFSWDLKNAFKRFEGIVDAYVGPQTFETVIEGISTDPMGPQIDIMREVLPYITTQFHIVSEVKKPISPDSKRSMVLLKLNDPAKKLNGVLDRFGKSEPNAQKEDFEGIRVYRIKNDAEPELVEDFGIGNNKKDTAQQSEDHLLDQYAVAIMDDYFIFASDAEMIKDTISSAKSGKEKGLFEKEEDVAKLKKAIESISGDGSSFVDITRSDRAFEMQYELFRQGKLPESKSILATILDKILKPVSNKAQQKLNGANLPPYEQIQSFFTPTGGIVKTEDDGWSLQSFILSK